MRSSAVKRSAIRYSTLKAQCKNSFDEPHFETKECNGLTQIVALGIESASTNLRKYQETGVGQHTSIVLDL